MYEIKPMATGLWAVVNTESGRIVVKGISREACQQLKTTLERNQLKQLLHLTFSKNRNGKGESRQEGNS